MRVQYRFFLLFCMMVFLFAPSALAKNTVAADLQKTYEGITAMQASFNQVLVHKESGSREQRKGVLYFKKPLLVRWETKSPAPELLLVTKNVIWNAFPDEEIAYKYALSLAQDSRSIIRVITGQASITQDFTIENKKQEGGLHYLILYPKKPTQSMVEAHLWVDPKTKLIKKLRIYDFYGNQNEMSFGNINPKATPSDAMFSYKPPKGYVVEDRTKDTNAAPSTMRGGVKNKKKK
ncbi:outer membrane lipoprotein carrier protein LolA [Desulfovibrio sp. OttesenSCG-928-G15]|nr:outer membrane lipoprotein carrier protein LolA [Desulfovibrio sp. OttesenSCG-928-G15]